MTTKVQQCLELLKILPDPINPTTKQIKNICINLKCHEATGWRALKKFRYLQISASKLRLNKKNRKGRGNNSSAVSLTPSIPTKPEPNKPQLPEKDPGFIKFCRWLSFPKYRGLHKWQLEHEHLTKDAKYELTLAPRKHGKSVKYCDKYQHELAYGIFDVLLLGWTDQRKVISSNVYTFCSYYDLIEVDKRTSPFHFKLKNGARFDCYLITSKDTLGMHAVGTQARFSNLSDEELIEFKSLFQGNEDDLETVFDEKILEQYMSDRAGSIRKLWISIDDPIDISFMKERHKEDDLEMKFNSQLYSIDPDKWSFTGTHKFQGDFFDFIIGKFGDKLVKYIREPIKKNGSLLCPERFTHPDIDTYENDLKLGKDDLAEIRKHIGEYAWHSEWRQDPHPITGEVWETVHYENLMKTWTHYDCLFINLDRATTTNPKSSYTGYNACLREKNDERLVIDDNTGFWEFEKLLIHLNRYVIEFNSIYKNIMIFIVLEKQGGGDDFFSAIDGRPKFYDAEYVDKDGDEGRWEDNKIQKHAIVILLHSRGDKKERIKTYLYARITNKKTKFLSALKHSELVLELLSFPHGPKLDGIDSLANMERAIDISPLIPPLSDGEKEVADDLIVGMKLRNLRRSRGYEQDFKGLIK